ncbi:MAG TPA: serine hydrolase domain-containing protein [Luteimonas sp.]|nr:serine hydrolase domain-containing protein [Luteimonas sp.]HRO26442.1 serine hydrolase domain-containing protein [Luteimonas sp.]HRP71193.1 serine hydrolase domain-containing protein [Luteimonas sp.]
MSRILRAAFAAVLLLSASVVASQEVAPATAATQEPPAASGVALAVAVDQPLVADAAADGTALPPPRAIDADDLSAYVDGLVDAAMKRDGIAGVTVAVVDREGPLLLRGYGISALSPRRGVDPDGTLFRIASISKTFTYLLALQLVDEGRLDLDKPANDYLPDALKLPDDGWPPVLVRHLFTHTAGFEDSAMGHLFVDRVERVTTTAEYLRQHRPKRVRAPGSLAVYSNYSVALLGALVEQVAGTPFDALAERRLFEPMGMRLTTFREPLREGDPRNAGPAFAGRWSEGFRRSGGAFKPQAFEHIAHAGPAGGASSTAADMGRYMRMLLRGGELDGVQVLTPSVHARLMGEALFRNAPEVGGFSYGFFDSRLGTLRVLGHGGATSWFHSMMSVAPEAGVGIFVSTNTDSGRRLAAQLPTQVLERYFEQARTPSAAAPPEGFDAARFAGRYNSKRSNYSSAEKPFLSLTVQVSAADDGSLVLSAGGDSSRWIPEGGLVFREAEGPGRIVFFEDDDGDIAGYDNAAGHNVFERVGPLAQGESLQAVIVLAGVVSLLVLVGAWLRRGRRDQAAPASRRSAFWLYLGAIAWLLFVSLFLVYLQSAMADETAVFYGYPGALLTALLWSTPVLFVLTLVDVVHLRAAWRARGWGLWRKLRHTLAVAVYVFAVYMLWSWNMVGWKL